MLCASFVKLLETSCKVTGHVLLHLTVQSSAEFGTIIPVQLALIGNKVINKETQNNKILAGLNSTFGCRSQN